MFSVLAFGAVHAWAYLTVQAVAAVVFGLWAVRLGLKAAKRPKMLMPPLAWAVLAFAGYAIARYFTADIEYIARLEIVLVLVYAAIFFTVVNNLREQESAEWVSWTLITLGTLVSFYAVGQFLSQSDRVWHLHSGSIARASGTYISPNHCAGFLEMVLPLALAFLLVGKMKIIPRILIGYAILMMMVALTMTFSRAGWVAAGAGIVLVLGILLFHKNHRLRSALLLAILLGGGALFVSKYLAKTYTYAQRVKSTASEAAGSNFDWDTRVAMWGAAKRMWQDHLWVGVGPAHYDYRFREYRPEMLQARPDRCHNDYLNLLADWGVIGGVIVFTGMGIFIWGLFKTWPHVRREENDFGSGQSNRFAFFLGAVGGLAAISVHSLMDFNLHIPANELVALTLLGLVTSNLRYATEGYWVRLFSRERVILMTTLGAVIAVLLVVEWRGSREAYWIARAENEGVYSRERAAALQKAFAAEPQNFQTAFNIGECYRVEGLEGGKNYQEVTRQAQEWYARSMKLNPHDGYSFLRNGMCLDWLGKHAEAEPFYSEAERLDPNGYYMVADIGWHYVQTGDYAAARMCFERSLRLFGNNPTAQNYHIIMEQKLINRASGRPTLPTFY